MNIEFLCHIQVLLGDELLQLSYLAHLFECQDFIFLVPIYCQACRVIPSVFETGEAYLIVSILSRVYAWGQGYH